jgi:hypothetical protein
MEGRQFHAPAALHLGKNSSLPKLDGRLSGVSGRYARSNEETGENRIQAHDFKVLSSS